MKVFTRTLISILAAVALSLTFALPQATAKKVRTDSDGHVLVKEWQDYAEAKAKNLPQKQLEVLGGIIDKALERGLSWDLYEAVWAHCETVGQTNWKKYEQVCDSLKRLVRDYDDPVLAWNLGWMWNFSELRPELSDIQAKKAELTKRKQNVFYQSLNLKSLGGQTFPEALIQGLKNDYEYLLWEVLLQSPYLRDGLHAQVSQLIKDYYSEAYPYAAFIGYLDILRLQDEAERRAALREYVRRYSDRGVSFYAKASLMQEKFDSLTACGAASQAFADLRQECGEYEKLRKAEKSDAGLTAGIKTVENLANRMDFKQIAVRVRRNTDSLEVILQNVSEADLRLAKDSVLVMERHLENPVCSYYVPDTLIVSLAGIDDGNYRITCSSGKLSAEFTYNRRTISISCTPLDNGIGIFAADYLTGEPVDSADVAFFQNGSLIWSRKCLALGGFTILRPGLEAPGRYQVQCRYRDENGVLRQSGRLYFTLGSGDLKEVDILDSEIVAQVPEAESADGNASSAEGSPSATLAALLFKNKAAFNPGDTLSYKSVVYQELQKEVPYFKKSWKRTEYAVWTGLDPIQVELADASGNIVARDSLTVNEMGSVSGSFVIPSGHRNGTWNLRVRHHGKLLSESRLTVDEYELPTFNLTFEPYKDISYSGDTVTVRGRLESYSGQAMASMTASYQIHLWKKVLQEGFLNLAEDGSFSISFRAGDPESESDYFYHRITVKVVAATGETQEFSTSVSGGHFSVTAELENEAKGSVELLSGYRERVLSETGADYYGVKLLEGDFAVLKLNVKNAGHDDVEGAALDYELYRLNSGQEQASELVTSGMTLSGEKLWIDLSSWSSGVYRLKAKAVAKGRTQTVIYDLISIDQDDKALDLPLENIFKVIPSENIKLQMGGTSGPIWAVVQLFGGDNICLNSELVYLNGRSGEEGSLKTLEYEFEEDYPDMVKLRIFYFRNGRHYVYYRNFEKKSQDMSLPLVFESFTDLSVPGGKCSYEILTAPGAECVVSVFDIASESFRANKWSRLVPRKQIPNPSVNWRLGQSNGWAESPDYMDITLSSGRLAYGMRNKSSLTGASAPVVSDTAEAIPFQMENESYNQDVGDGGSDGIAPAGAPVSVREDFSDVLAFEPFLRADEEGKTGFSFEAGGRLSTFAVSVFAHDRGMNSAVLRRTMSVRLPVSLAVNQPAVLYEGDRYDLGLSLSNVSEADSEGVLSVYVYDTEEFEDAVPVLVKSRPVRVERASAAAGFFSIDVPSGVDVMGIKAVYCAADGVSDGVFVSVPVRAAEQSLTEAHSALWMEGMDKDSVYAELRREFVNVSGFGAEAREISVGELLEEAVAQEVEVDGPDLVALVRAWESRVVSLGIGGSGVGGRAVVAGGTGVSSGSGVDSGSGAGSGVGSGSGVVGGSGEVGSLGVDGSGVEGGSADVGGDLDARAEIEELEGRILRYVNLGGGFSWLMGGPSSPAVTAYVLEQVAILKGMGFLVADGVLEADGSGMGSSGLGSSGLESSGVGTSGVETSGMESSGVKSSGMGSSGLRSDGEGWKPGSLIKEAVEDAVKYLDRYYFGEDRLSFWAGDISFERYLHIRSVYRNIPLSLENKRLDENVFYDENRINTNVSGDKKRLDENVSEKKKRLRIKDFAKQARNYLQGRGNPDGAILYKVRRAETALNFLNDSKLSPFAESIGLKLDKKLPSKVQGYIESLKQYAVNHPSGGVYYSNAVLPFRGLLEDELYAHVLICRLMDSVEEDISEGIRLWMILQKETQNWDASPAYMLALAAVADGSEALKSAKILILKQNYCKPFEEIKAAGNGMSLSCRYFVEDQTNQDGEFQGYREVQEGEHLQVGEKVLAVYNLWSAENRSYVRLTAPRHAALRPENQLSGASWMRFVAVPASRTSVPTATFSAADRRIFAPYTYREVKSDRTNWYFEVLPEEDRQLTETLLVTRAGKFTCPAPELECLYAPHYRANDACPGSLTVASQVRQTGLATQSDSSTQSGQTTQP